MRLVWEFNRALDLDVDFVQRKSQFGEVNNWTIEQCIEGHDGPPNRYTHKNTDWYRLVLPEIAAERTGQGIWDRSMYRDVHVIGWA